MSTEILECPFCGGKDVNVIGFGSYVRELVDDINGDIYYDYEGDFDENDDGYLMRCTSMTEEGRACMHVGGWQSTREKAIASWNNRAENVGRTSVVFKRKKDTMRR